MDELRGDRTYLGEVIFANAVTFPAGQISNSHVAAGANISAEKLEHRHAISHAQANGADVTSETVLVHVCRAIGELISIDVRPTTVPTGGDKQYTIDVQTAANGSNTWTSVLSDVITVDSGETDHTLIAGVLDGAPTTADGTAIRVVVTASGSTGSQGQGFVVTVNLDERAS